ncbi:hypothetical protein DPMN_168551 [Dreissena polymorpha]|uniref:Uncharacterized protein n=1 Tax=Dreissena polymorpha TaxID=45954 RepID=A0A9D4IZR7_DREPO|nr:hypothetical protein DPMN_168551 [Dreissena polymorpha]
MDFPAAVWSVSVRYLRYDVTELLSTSLHFTSNILLTVKDPATFYSREEREKIKVKWKRVIQKYETLKSKRY